MIVYKDVFNMGKTEVSVTLVKRDGLYFTEWAFRGWPGIWNEVYDHDGTDADIVVESLKTQVARIAQGGPGRLLDFGFNVGYACGKYGLGAKEQDDG